MPAPVMYYVRRMGYIGNDSNTFVSFRTNINGNGKYRVTTPLALHENQGVVMAPGAEVCGIELNGQIIFVYLKLFDYGMNDLGYSIDAMDMVDMKLANM